MGEREGRRREGEKGGERKGMGKSEGTREIKRGREIDR